MSQSVRRRRVVKTVIVLAVLLLFLIVASAVAARLTESDKFCARDCHEMNVYGSTWEKSAHNDVHCVECHIPPGTVNFVKTKAYALHEVWVHLSGEVQAPIAVTRHIPDDACLRPGCHTAAELRKPVIFPSTSFEHPAHAEASCIECHSQLVHRRVGGRAYVPPRSMRACFSCHTDGPKDCTYCHEVPHDDRGPCSECHSLSSWGPKDFKHPQPLVGEHAKVVCEQCHVNGIGSKPTGCMDCHGDQHNGLKDCIRCHRITAWTPTTFVHPQEGPHVPAGEEPLPCDACHGKGFATGGCPCHGGSPPVGD